MLLHVAGDRQQILLAICPYNDTLVFTSWCSTAANRVATSSAAEPSYLCLKRAAFQVGSVHVLHKRSCQWRLSEHSTTLVSRSTSVSVSSQAGRDR